MTELAERKRAGQRREAGMDRSDLRPVVAGELAVEDRPDDREHHAGNERMDTPAEEQQGRHEHGEHDR